MVGSKALVLARRARGLMVDHTEESLTRLHVQLDDLAATRAYGLELMDLVGWICMVGWQVGWAMALGGSIMG